MNIKKRSIHCRKIFLIGIIILCFITVQAVTLPRNGKLHLDAELFSTSNIDLIVQNWHKLVEEELFWETYSDIPDNQNGCHSLYTRNAFLSQDDSLYFALIDINENAEKSQVNWSASYSKTGLRDALRYNETFGEYENHLFIKSPQLEATIFVRHSDSNGERIIAEWEHILDIVSAK